MVLSSLGSFRCFQVHILNPDPRQAQALTGVEDYSDCSVEVVKGSSGGSLGDREWRSRQLRTPPGKVGRQQEVNQGSKPLVHATSAHWIPLTKQKFQVKIKSFKIVSTEH